MTAITLESMGPEVTERIGFALGRALRAGDLLDIDGPLGAGKTCLVRGIVAGAGADPAAVRSPTFVLHQPHRAARLTVHHVDLYRLGPSADIGFLDLDALLEDGAAAIEWGEYGELGIYVPVRIDVSVDSGDRRHLDIRSAPAHLRSVWEQLAMGESS